MRSAIRWRPAVFGCWHLASRHPMIQLPRTTIARRVSGISPNADILEPQRLPISQMVKARALHLPQAACVPGHSERGRTCDAVLLTTWIGASAHANKPPITKAPDLSQLSNLVFIFCVVSLFVSIRVQSALKVIAHFGFSQPLGHTRRYFVHVIAMKIMARQARPLSGFGQFESGHP